MSRIKLQLPDSFIFSTQIEVTINFINYGGHLGNDSVLTLCQEARMRFFKESGFDELNFYGKSLIQADCAIVYKAQAFHGDMLEVKLTIQDIGSHGFDFSYQLINTENKKEVARVKTGLVFFDYENQQVSKCPQVFIDKYSS